MLTGGRCRYRKSLEVAPNINILILLPLVESGQELRQMAAAVVLSDQPLLLPLLILTEATRWHLLLKSLHFPRWIWILSEGQVMRVGFSQHQGSLEYCLLLGDKALCEDWKDSWIEKMHNLNAHHPFLLVPSFLSAIKQEYIFIPDPLRSVQKTRLNLSERICEGKPAAVFWTP